jgi:VWFA-related protein
MLRARTACAVMAISLLGAHGGDAQQQPPQASFRSRITIVPLDVRVLDRNGKPVTDLKQEDFTIFEDEVPQPIRYFSSQSLSAQTPATAGQPELRKALTAEGLAPQNRRVFLILLGRGRMKGPSKEIPALLEFLQKRVLPQDQVAVLAFNRGTDFTTDHEAVRAVVERYRDRHEKIETLLDEYLSGLRAVYVSMTIPAFIQT